MMVFGLQAAGFRLQGRWAGRGRVFDNEASDDPRRVKVSETALESGRWVRGPGQRRPRSGVDPRKWGSKSLRFQAKSGRLPETMVPR